jgi:hypothetical protein
MEKHRGLTITSILFSRQQHSTYLISYDVSSSSSFHLPLLPRLFKAKVFLVRILETYCISDSTYIIPLDQSCHLNLPGMRKKSIKFRERR